MPRPSFSVVAGTLTALVALGLVRRYLGPLVPPSRGAVSPEGADYLRAGDAQTLPWRALSPELMAEAKRRGRPVLLVFGDMASRAARELDARTFGEADVVRAIGGEFLCARVDLAVSPEWRAALSPGARTAGYLDPGFAVVAVGPSGEPLVALAPGRLDEIPDKYALLSFLDDARGALRAGGVAPLAKGGAAERARLAGGVPALPPPDFALGLRDRTDRGTGLVAVPGGGRVSPWALDAIARAGEPRFAVDAFEALAQSPMQDPVAGGVFASVTIGPGGRRIECTKSLATNAALAESAARAGALAGDAGCLDLARRTAGWCLDQLAAKDGAPATLVSDQRPDGFSPYYSLTFRRLADRTVPGRAEEIRAALGADRDPQALGRLSRPPSVTVAAALRALRDAPPFPEGANRGRAETALTALARLLGTARLLGDREQGERLGQQVETLSRGFDPTTADLSSLLAFADARFADFLTNGRAEGLDLAARALERAIARFGGAGGALRSGDGIAGLGIAPDAPDLADGYGEASAATAVRLCDAVGRALDTGAPGTRGAARRLRRFARGCASRYAPSLGTDARNPMGSATPQAAGFLAACAAVARPTWRVCGGPDPVGEAARAAARAPYDLAVPAIGSAAPPRPADPRGPRVRTMNRP